ncbi:RNA-binding domain-containing protein [Accumulibacter sp.]|uniref:RNA-binding domain-containing protein n=1 Tax=Accumulibacter sp. TaxID=2053492 RepID=UPI0026275145|nr:RNA-binding domain-containing protein [Accumulibacter sp.]
MTPAELDTVLARGEDSRHQFKRDFTNADSLAAELAALANGGGGQILIGVADDGQPVGLTQQDIGRLNQLLSNAASQHVRPPLSPTSQNIQTDQGLVLVVNVALGLNKPYMDLQGRVWVKNGADKRHVTAREEMQRMFQASGLLQADQVPVSDASWADIDERAFTRYFERRYKQSPEQTGLALPALFENLKLATDGVPNLAGMLLFGKNPERHLHVCMVAAVCFPGTRLSDSRYLDSENIQGSLEEQFQSGMGFIKRNLHHVQGNQGFNSLGLLEVPEEAFIELLVNALVHRDFFTNATIRLFIFVDRVEIISPGPLPDSLTHEQILTGRSNRRNKVLAEHAAHILPYRGLGTGIPRALGAWPRIDLIDERDGNQFKAVLWRPRSEQVTEQVERKPAAKNGQVTEQVTGQVGTESGPSRDQVGTRFQLTQEHRALLAKIDGEHAITELMAWANRSNRTKFRNQLLTPLLTQGLMEMTIPDKPNSSKQRYRLTPSGQQIVQPAKRDS